MAAILRDKTVRGAAEDRQRHVLICQKNAHGSLLRADHPEWDERRLRRGGQEAFAWSSLNSCASSSIPYLRHVVSCLTTRSFFAFRAIWMAVSPAADFAAGIAPSDRSIEITFSLEP